MFEKPKENKLSLISACFLFLSKIKNLLFLRSDVWSIKSNGRCTESIKIIFLGGDVDKNYFANLIYGGNYDERYLGKMWIGRLLIILWMLRKRCDLLIAVNKTYICNIFKTPKSFILPTWVNCELNLCATSESQSLSRSTLKNNIRKIKKEDYHYIITRDPEDFHLFYHSMYLPYISKKYNSSAVIDSFVKMKKFFDHGELLLIQKDKRPISGALIQYNGNSPPKLRNFGIFNGDSSYVKKGALTAAYFYSIQYLKKKKIKKLDFGGSRPFFFDGVLRNKLIWGGKLVYDQQSCAVLLCPNANLNGIKNFFLNNPFIHKEENQLILAVHYNKGSEKTQQLKKIENKLKNFGICGVNRL